MAADLIDDVAELFFEAVRGDLPFLKLQDLH